MKAVLIDDEYYALQGLRLRLDEIGGIDVVGVFTNTKLALEKIVDLKPDIIFLDIEMPNVSGIELYSQILDVLNDVKIVFTTAYEQYAVQAFELNALDYIVKPIEKDRIIKTLDRYREVKSVCLKSATTSVSINCFGKLSIMADGKEISSNLRRKSEELLAFLICQNGRFVAKEKIMDALWPELDKDKAANNLYVAFYNLKRHELGALTDIIESARGKMRIRIEQIECDLFEFRKLFSCCVIIDSLTVKIARKATELYRGMLFEEDYFEWVQMDQAQLEGMYLCLLDKMIKYSEGVNDFTGIKYYENIRENYSCSE